MPETELVPTPGQTIGPFFHYAMPYPGDNLLVPPGTAGAVRLHGYLYDGEGVGIPDALLEIRQADPNGHVPVVEGSRRREGVFTGWGRTATDSTGHFSFTTLEPGPTPDGSAAFFAVSLFARGLMNRLFTRIYVPGDGAPTDPGLSTLVAAREAGQSLRFDVHLQGDKETVFLTFPRLDQ